MELLKGFAGRKIVAIDGTSGTFVPVDARGQPVHQPVMYYEKALEEHKEIARLPSAAELAKRGVSVDPGSPLAKLLSLRRKGVLERARWIVPQATFIAYRLVLPEGAAWDHVETDYNNALKFGADITREPPAWFQEIYEEAGIPLELMPEIVEPGKYIGIASSRLAEALGLAGAEVYHGTTDGNAAALASGALAEGDCSISTGTTTVPKFVTGELRPHAAVYYHRHPIRGFLASAATSFTGGFLSWLVEKVAGLTMEEADRLVEAVLGERVPAFLPPGDRSPFNDPSLRAALLGLEVVEEPRGRVLGKLFLSVMLGVALLEDFYVRLFEELGRVKIGVVKMSGGTTRSGAWLRLRASIFGKPVVVYSERVGLGALIPAMLRGQLFRDVREIEELYLKVQRRAEPDPQLAAAYGGARKSFEAAWRSLANVYGVLGKQ
ncbi:MAG: FGGY-family carbohydrate kinase [Desulfurococcaceae archaeon]